MTNAGSVLDISTDPVTIFRTVNEDLRKHLQERFSKLDKSRTGLAGVYFQSDAVCNIINIW
jgi:hypothetical protein